MRTIIASVLLGVSLASAQTIQELTTAETFKTSKDGTLLYRQHVSADIPKGKKVPLVILLHGAGERGDDNIAQTKHGMLPLIKYGDANGGAIVIAPQCPAEQFWKSGNFGGPPSTNMKLLLALIDAKVKAMPVDPARIYVTGLSMGGFGTWDLIQRRPNLVAAAIPICGGGEPSMVSAIKKIPIWIFHGDKDTTVPTARSREMAEALKKAKGNFTYTEYPGVAHDSWTQTYANTEVLEWLFKQSRSGAQTGTRELKPLSEKK